MIALVGCAKQENTPSPPPPPPIDYAAKYVGTWLVRDSANWNLLSTGGGYPDCLTNRVVNRVHNSIITKSDPNSTRGIKISNYFGDSTQEAQGSIQDTYNDIVLSLLPIKFYKTSCYVAPAPQNCDPDSCYYYIGLTGFIDGRISSTGDTITLSYSYHGSTQWGYAYMTIDGYFKSTLIRQ